MTAAVKFRRLLPVVQSGFAALFGGLGLWERSAILSRVFTADGQTLWDSTARFHVWPWPIKFAVVTNLPAVLAWALPSWPIAERWPDLPESITYAPALPFVAILWYATGVWMDRRWGSLNRPAFETKTPWILLSLFTALCMIAAFIHIQYPTSDYMLLGAAIWLAIGIGIGTSTLHRKICGRS